MITDEEKRNLQRLFNATNTMNEPITGSTVLEWYERRRLAKEKFGLIFSSANLEKLTKEDFISFLYFENNQSWTGLYRRGTEAAEHLNELKKAIAYLQDESIDIKTRINEVLDGKLAVKGMGKNLATAILHVCDKADKYGVWNNMAEGTLEKLGLLPEMTTNKGEAYARINEVLNNIKRELNTDLDHVDCFMYMARELLEGETTGKIATSQMIEGVSFRLEKELIDFLAKNISVIESGLQFREKEYPTDAGRIDLLCVDKKGDFVVIETKKGRESDKVVGQISRYMGWIKLKMANHKQNVRGIIITNEPDEQLSYAIAPHDNIKLKYYRVKFELADNLPS
jgi:hypothetical protein